VKPFAQLPQSVWQGLVNTGDVKLAWPGALFEVRFPWSEEPLKSIFTI
jgi:hypothetical protein